MSDRHACTEHYPIFADTAVAPVEVSLATSGKWQKPTYRMVSGICIPPVRSWVAVSIGRVGCFHRPQRTHAPHPPAPQRAANVLARVAHCGETARPGGAVTRKTELIGAICLIASLSWGNNRQEDIGRAVRIAVERRRAAE